MLALPSLALLSFLLAPQAIQRWGTFELALQGPAAGNPFLDVTLSADFQINHRAVTVDGFYDGSGTYKIRFMPDSVGNWSFTTHSNRPELANKTGAFECTPNTGVNHGPVIVRNTYHFSYSDGTPFLPFGTTAYAWIHQGDALEQQTLDTLAHGPFNKIRMCVFPKSYAFNANEPVYYPFPRNTSTGENDFTHFNPDFFRHLEQRVAQLRDLGIEADLILFHPYDRWGYQSMPSDVDDRYLHYLIARLSAYRNVWWSMANEWDFMKHKTLADFDRYFKIVQQNDPYQHLRSIHNGAIIYDHTKPWVTHASIQGDDFTKAAEYRATYKKPVIWDECKYEGNIPQRWGNISAQEMIWRFWRGISQGTYVGHGETYLDPANILWWSKGGTLHGESPKRIAFLRQLLEREAPDGLNPIPNLRYDAAATSDNRFYLYFLDIHQPAELEFQLPDTSKYEASLVDPWEMKIEPIAGEHSGKFTLKLPAKPYQAVVFRRTSTKS